MAQSLAELQSRFSIPRVLNFEAGPAGFLRAVVRNPHAQAMLYLHGAHLVQYQPTGQRDLLFLSKQSVFDRSRPIRGGVPIVFPWFGPRVGDPSAPLHGFVRTMTWAFDSAEQAADGPTRLTLSVRDNEATRQVWPHPFVLTYTLTIGPALLVDVDVHNPGPDQFAFEEALHPYFAVGDVREVAITGLAGAEHVDRALGANRRFQGPDPIRIVSETDRVYVRTSAGIAVEDTLLKRRLLVEKFDSASTVLWNPWIAKAKAMPDFGDEEWTQMLCIEPGNIWDQAISLAPGGRHRMSVRVSAKQL